MDKSLVTNIIMIAYRLENKAQEVHHMEDYLEALHDGRIDYTEEKEATAKAGYRIAKAEQSEIIKELKDLLSK